MASQTDLAPDEDEKLRAAWQAVLARLVQEGYPERACAETMIAVAVSRICDGAGLDVAKRYLDVLRERIAAEQDLKLAELGRAAVGHSEDTLPPLAGGT
jgi:hypothetical protein